MDKWTNQILSKHYLMANFLVFNTARDKFFTCGQDGQMNVYEFDEKGNAKRIAYAYIFRNQQACTAAKWANNVAGGKIAISGSKGSIVIINVDKDSGEIRIEADINNQNTAVISMDWHPEKKLLLCGDVSGKISVYYQQSQLWTCFKYIKNNKQFSQHPAQVAWSTAERVSAYVAFQSSIIIIRNFLTHDISNPFQTSLDPVFTTKQPDQKILCLLSRSEISQSGMTELIVLTTKFILVIHSWEMQHKLIQKIPIPSKGYEKMDWGWGNGEIGLYRGLSEDKQGETDGWKKVEILKRKLGGFWKLQQY